MFFDLAGLSSCFLAGVRTRFGRPQTNADEHKNIFCEPRGFGIQAGPGVCVASACFSGLGFMAALKSKVAGLSSQLNGGPEGAHSGSLGWKIRDLQDK